MNLDKGTTMRLPDDFFKDVDIELLDIEGVSSYIEECPMDITVESGYFQDASGLVSKNCGSHSIEYIKKYGLKGLVTLGTTSKPAKTASVLTGHLNTYLASMQAYYAGALGLGYVNTFYAPYLMGMTDKEIKQVAQEIIFNCSQNAFSRGGQSLFVDTNLDTGVPSYFKKIPAIGPGGKYMFVPAGKTREEWVPLEEACIEDDWCLVYNGPDGNHYAVVREHDGKQTFNYPEQGKVLTYGDFENETQRMCSALLDVWYEGDANGHVFEFPKCDFHVDADTFTDPKRKTLFDKACRLASHNGSTYFVFDRDSVSLASCCFTGDTEIIATLDKDTKPSRMKFSSLPENAPIYTFGPPQNYIPAEYPECYEWPLREYRLVKLTGSFKMSRIIFGPEYAVSVTEDHGFVDAYGADIVAADIGEGCLLQGAYPAGYSFIDHRGETVYAMPDSNKNLVSVDNCYEVQEVEDAGTVTEVYCLEAVDPSKPYFLLPNGVISHNCRLKVTITDKSMLLHPEKLRTVGFGNVTVNIPQCAYRAQRATKEGDAWDAFIKEIDNAMDIAVKCHMEKRKFLEYVMKPGGPMWQIAKPANDGNPYMGLDDCVYIIGMIGVNDAIQFLYGKQLHESDEAFDMGLKIISHMFHRCKEYSEKYGLTFKLEESPAESAARRLAKADLMYYRPEALQVYKGGDEKYAYYTNSIHIAADADVSLVDRIRKQSMFHSAIESGAIIHAFIGEEKPEPGAIAELVTQVFTNTQAAQLTFSPEFTYCQDCGAQQRGLHEKCDQCGSTNVVGETRVVGYFSTLNSWNASKRYGELIARHQGQYRVCTVDDEEAR